MLASPEPDAAALARALPARGWRASLEVAVARGRNGSVIARRAHRGPLVVQRAFHPEGLGRPHVYLLHPPGGLVGADELEVSLRVEERASALFTTPAATKIYRTQEGVAASTQRQSMVVADEAACEWLPQETIVFSGARAALATRVELAPSARFVGWEVLCLGRPAAGERFDRGSCTFRFELYRGAVPIVLERTSVRAGAALAAAAWGLGGRPVLGMAIASPAPAETLDDELRSIADEASNGALASVTRVDGALVARYLGDEVEAARAFFVRWWCAVRPDVMDAAPVLPRIWAT